MKFPSFPFKIIDLTHTIDANIPLWPGSEPFSMKIRYDYHEVGCRAVSYSLVAGTGTHMDAPAHFIQDATTIDQIPINNLIAPLCVINTVEKVKNNADYTLQSADLIEWEQAYGKIPPASVVVMNTGWAARWPNLKSFLNEDANKLKHFPGFSVEASQLLLERGVVGIGIDTFSLDAGIATTFPVHNLMLARGVYFLECLTNLNSLPAQGAFIGVFPLKIAHAPEISARIIALVAQH